jgi:hypothetical protein
MFMAELFLVCMVVTLVILTIRAGRPVILDKPVIIHRPNQYHITLAPQLNRAQVFIEHTAAQLLKIEPAIISSRSIFFSVNDTKICTSTEKFYLLAVSARRGIWYFQAILPQPLLHDCDSHYRTVSEFAAAVLLEQPATLDREADAAIINDVVIGVAARAKIPTLLLSKLS